MICISSFDAHWILSLFFNLNKFSGHVLKLVILYQIFLEHNKKSTYLYFSSFQKYFYNIYLNILLVLFVLFSGTEIFMMCIWNLPLNQLYFPYLLTFLYFFPSQKILFSQGFSLRLWLYFRGIYSTSYYFSVLIPLTNLSSNFLFRKLSFHLLLLLLILYWLLIFSFFLVELVFQKVLKISFKTVGNSFCNYSN